jgi:hypothetical protein
MRVNDVFKASMFWDAQETDLFSLPQIAITLSIGRNRMCEIPVKRFMVDKRAYYKKSDILDWALSTDGEKLLNELRDKNSKIKKLTQARTRAYEQLATRHVSHYRAKGKKETRKERYKRLCSEWGTYLSGHASTGIERQILTCNNNEKLKELVAIAWSLREQFVSLKMGLPRGMNLNNWWFEKDFDLVLMAKKKALIEDIKNQIKWKKEELSELKSHGLKIYPLLNISKNVDIEKLTTEILEDTKIEIDLLKKELEDLG